MFERTLWERDQQIGLGITFRSTLDTCSILRSDPISCNFLKPKSINPVIPDYDADPCNLKSICKPEPDLGSLINRYRQDLLRKVL